MRDFLKRLYRQTVLGRYMLRPFVYFRDHILPKRISTALKFKRLLGYRMNLAAPKTFNEKLHWLNIHDRRPLHTQCADKYAVRRYVKGKLGPEYLIPLVFHSEDPADLIPEKFPDSPFIIKANHDSSGGVFVREKSRVDWAGLRKKFAKRLRINYYYENGEWQYKNIRPCILAEKLLTDEDGNIPADFKLFCFNGKVIFIQLDLDRESDHKRNMYDTQWNLLEFKYVYQNGRTYPKPVVLDKMVQLAEMIGKDFEFVRVDFYNIGEKIYFGEITFHPESGFGKFIPGSWDRTYGDMLRLKDLKD